MQYHANDTNDKFIKGSVPIPSQRVFDFYKNLTINLIKILMKCSYYNLNICFLALFVMFCIANSIMIENNNILKGNNVISKPESINLLKVFQMKKVAQNELKILKMKRDKIDKSMKRLSFLSTENDDERTSLNMINFL